ncbi:MAG: isopenicillin N synthase family oxygenase [Pyrinomonadaceae bacterium]|nr:isopenicillin N synthase family oxygenase [Pyrinomonadaceae bacterium]
MSSADQKKEEGIHAKNQEFRRYDQVRKDHEYNLVEHGEDEQFDDEFEIRTCDLSLFFEGGEAGKARFAEELGEALETIGFAILSNTGIEPSIYKKAETAIAELFEKTSVEERLEFEAQRHGSVNQGYFPIKETTQIHPDLVEGWVYCRRAFDLDGDEAFEPRDFWLVAEQEPIFRHVVVEQEKLILPVMQSILRYLDVDEHLYDERLTGTNFGFRLNYYPPLDIDSNDAAAGRMLGHEDVDLFTFLPAQNVEGLQVYNRENGKWIRLNAPPGTIVLNTGDYMQRITNDRLPSTTHRVSRPSDPKLNSFARISMPMAVYVWEDEVLEVLPGLGEPKYEPISAIEFHTRITSKYYGDEYAVKG